MKTSQEYPLQIDFTTIPNTGGRIGMTICPGKKQIGAMSGDWDRDLDSDLQAIEAWGATVIVNLIEDQEMAELGVQDTKQYIPAGLEYIRLPIPDFGVPGASWERQWETIGPALVNRLRLGEAVLLHCKGGLGRTGMIASCLLVQMGYSAKEAIQSVRQARPGTIETAAQEAYVGAVEYR